MNQRKEFQGGEHYGVRCGNEIGIDLVRTFSIELAPKIIKIECNTDFSDEKFKRASGII